MGSVPRLLQDEWGSPTEGIKKIVASPSAAMSPRLFGQVDGINKGRSEIAVKASQ